MDKHYIDIEVGRRVLAVEHINTGSWSGPQPYMVRLSEEEVYPGWSVMLTADEAHKLGVWLLEQSAEAELRNLEAETARDYSQPGRDYAPEPDHA